MSGARFNRHTFTTVAEAVKRAGEKVDKSMGDIIEQYRGVELVARELCDAFADGSGHFDRELFLRNCGVRK